MVSFRLALAVALVSTLVRAEPDPRPITMADFLASSETYVGRRVIITDCTISRANALRAYCSDTRQFGFIYLDGETMDALSREKAVEHCAAPSLKPACAAIVAGLVYPYPDRPRIRGALIFWRSVEQAGKWNVSDHAGWLQ
jgi:hypothetical protein